MASSSSARARSEGVGSPVAVRWFSVREVEKPMAPARSASVARTAHGRGIVLGRILQAGGPFTHDVETQCAVGELRAQVDVVGPLFDGVEILAEGFPFHSMPFVEHRAGNVLHAFHERNEAIVRVGPHRCETHAAIAHHGRRHAMPARRRHAVVPGGLAVVVRVDVDEARE